MTRASNAPELLNALGMERITVASRWSSSRPQAAEPQESVRLANVIDDDGNADTPMHAMSNIFGGSYSRRSSDTSNFMRENAYGEQGHTGGMLLGKQKDVRGFHPSGVSHTADAQNQAMYGAGAERLLREAYQLVHPATGVEAGPAMQEPEPSSSQEIQRGYSGLPQISGPSIINPSSIFASTHDLSSRYSPRASTVPYPAPSVHSHDEPHIESAHSAGRRSVISQFGGVVGDPHSRSYTDGPRTTSVGSNPPPALQTPHHSIDRYTHAPGGPQGPFVPAPPQEQNVQSQQPSLDILQGRDHIGPPLPIASQARRASQTPQTSLYSQDVTNQVGPCTGAAASNSNELARRLALDALSASTNTRVLQDANQHLR
ncbi:hypothetical protein PAXRUDRAFT_719492 [Paxillus rubicundulus Ve08.2h10]|uniref:Uncharacterized protein n=1 Tax=Paxillus rubicundulus Ve08.2h10 TaxID=930991 RepID=A0A0D0E821_9AGAM|nr:hypothetical protein PAXRUDRAFT_719492 [Paxillus rubicundulus Ve08.2h10]